MPTSDLNSLVALALTFVAGWFLARARYWWLGQVRMKERVRSEINEHIESGNVRVIFRDGQSMTAEQLLQFICYGQPPDPNDPSKGRNHYNPH